MSSPMLLKERTPALVALVALVVMLGAHVVLRSSADLSPWKGGGFAMFSTVDSPGLRSVTVWADVAGVAERVSLAPPLDDASRDLRALPTASRTASLARAVAASTLVRRADGSLATTSTHGRRAMLAPTTGAATAPVVQDEAVAVGDIRVDVMRLTFADGVVRSTSLHSATAAVSGEG
jgi:hypothetical protein